MKISVLINSFLEKLKISWIISIFIRNFILSYILDFGELPLESVC